MTRVRTAEHTLKYMWNNVASESVRQPSGCRILVIGVGGSGNNTVTRLMEMGSPNAECVAVNTDAVHLGASKAHQKIA